jgi:type VI secretion system secreted protein VgrG
MPVIPSSVADNPERRDDQGEQSPPPSTPEVMQFHSDALEDDNDLQVMNLNGVESISSPYVFRIELASTNRSIDLNEILKEAAWVSIKQGVRTPGSDERSTVVHRIHGVITSIRQTGREMEWIKYEAVLEPRLSRARLAHNSRIFQDLNVPDLVKKVLEEYGIDIEDKLAEDHPTREFIVQYEESDLDFIHRWMEHEGIFYYFTQDEEKETMVLADTPENYSAMPGDNQFRFRPVGNTGRSDANDSEDADDDWFREELVTALICDVNHMPKEVILNDYNWRTPSDQLECKATVDDDGVGVVYEYNNHYKDLDEGRHLAEIRADEIACRKFVFHGMSECRGFRAGMVFELKQPESDDEATRNGLNDDFYQEYLITSVTHSASQTLALGSRMIGGATYSNTFEAIPKSGRTFRPKCETNWPSIKGVMHAKVDGPEDDSDYAQIDDAGRYKVKFPLDRHGDEDGTASKWVRKSETYAGPNQGMHFPLLKGSEVLVTYIDGDPDRPVISGAMYNEQTTNVTNEHNHELNIMITPAGNCLQIDDTRDAPQIHLYTTEQKNMFFMDGTINEEKIEITNNTNLIQIDAREGNEFILFRSENKNTFIRLGKKSDYDEDKGKGDAEDGEGIRIGTAGDYNRSVGGDAGIQIDGDENKTVGGECDEEVKGPKFEWSYGDWFTFKAAASVDISIGASFTAKFAIDLTLSYAFSAKIERADGFEATWGKKVVYDKAKKTEIGFEGFHHVVIEDKKLESKAGMVGITGARNVTLESPLGIFLKCGASSIEMTPDEIKIVSPKSHLVGHTECKIVSATKVDVSSSGALKCKGTPGGVYE